MSLLNRLNNDQFSGGQEDQHKKKEPDQTAELSVKKEQKEPEKKELQEKLKENINEAEIKNKENTAKKILEKLELQGGQVIHDDGVSKNDKVVRRNFLEKVLKIHRDLINETEIDFNEINISDEDIEGREKIKKFIEKSIVALIEKNNYYFSRREVQHIVTAVINETIGLGPLEELVKDEHITEIMVINKDQTYIEKNGKIELTPIIFFDEEHLKRIISRIVSKVGRRIDEGMPMVDARLQDGSRVNAIIPPLALKGPCLTIRKFSVNPYTSKDLIRFGSFTPAMEEFIKACVRASLNIVVSGGTGSGKTTLLNVLSSFIPDDQRIITIEDSAELQLKQEHLVTLESRPANIEGSGEITIRDLVKNSLRMRPDRIVIGECRGAEALDMLQAMNTGHDGSMTTAHANSPRDLIARVETMVLMAGLDLPISAVRQQISGAFDLIVQQSRLQDGSRKITSISEVCGMEGDIIQLKDLFVYKQTGYDHKSNKLIGEFMATGLIPSFLDRVRSKGIDLPLSIFERPEG